MSAILPDFDSGFELGPDGVRRYHTTCKVLIHGHNSQNVLDVSQDVVSISTSKSTKGIGSAAIAVTPNKNYLNLVNANDYINIYFDLGDNKGLTRTFFGLVDRIEENYAVDRLGKPTTTYHIISSDFQKIFEKTHIYFNPYLKGRDDLVGDVFGTSNIGGVALATKGVAVHGSPADIVQNLVVLMLGFGTQFSLPDSYNASPPFDSRGALLDYIESGLAEGSKKIIFDAGGFKKFLERERAAAKVTALAKDSTLQEIGLGQSPEELIASESDLLFGRLKETIQGDPTNAANFGPGILNAIPLKGDTTPSLLTILNLFDFVELASIDGYTTELSIWQQTGPISSLLRAFSNEVVNELMFDLRAVTVSEEVEDYATKPDEIAGNVAAEGSSSANGITHVPAIVFREYPFATINEFDGSDVQINIRGASGEVEKLGKSPFGAVFSNRRNDPGRHNIEFPAISYSSRIRGKAVSINNRKLDVAVVREQEIKKSTFGKTDHEHVNLIETTNESALLGNSKFFMQELQPITTPIHIMRNGLRVRSTPTRFAKFAPVLAGSLDPRIVVPQSQEEAEIVAAAEKEEEESSDIAKLQAPIQGKGTSQKPSKHGYRFPKDTPTDKNIYKFHNGVDLFAPIGTKVLAIADGEIVMSAPKGGLSYYSQTIIIRHPKLGPSGEDLYSQYSHLSERLIAWKPDSLIRREFVTKGMNPRGIPRGAGGTVKAGDPIGLVGNEGGTPKNPNQKFKSNPHLHFELLVKRGGLIYPAKRGSPPKGAQLREIEDTGGTVFKSLDKDGVPTLSSEHGFRGATPHIDPQGDNPILKKAFNSRPRLSPLDGDNERSLDPIKFFADNGINLETQATGGAPAVADTDENLLDEPQPQNEDSSTEKPKDPKPTVKELTVQASTGATRIESRLSGVVPFRQLARWSLLQDHWYQHNAEYLSGSIEMRGAPEIRVGYRLDLIDRDLSFYIEAVNHSWQFPNDMVTVLQVTRGQPNNPFPLYVPPVPHKKQGKDGDSRLAKFFVVPDPIAVRRGVALRSSAYADEPKSIEPSVIQGLEDPATYLPEETLQAETSSTLSSVREAAARAFEDPLDILDLDLSPIPSQSGVSGTDTTSGLPKK